MEPRTELLTAKARNINDFLPPEIFSLIFETLLNIRLEEDLDEAERLTVVQDLPSVVSSQQLSHDRREAVVDAFAGYLSRLCVLEGSCTPYALHLAHRWCQ